MTNDQERTHAGAPLGSIIHHQHRVCINADDRLDRPGRGAARPGHRQYWRKRLLVLDLKGLEGVVKDLQRLPVLAGLIQRDREIVHKGKIVGGVF